MPNGEVEIVYPEPEVASKRRKELTELFILVTAAKVRMAIIAAAMKSRDFPEAADAEEINKDLVDLRNKIAARLDEAVETEVRTTARRRERKGSS